MSLVGLCACSLSSQSGEHELGVEAGDASELVWLGDGTPDTSLVRARAVQELPGGRLLVGGTFRGTATLGGVSAEARPCSSVAACPPTGDSTDVFIGVANADGTPGWMTFARSDNNDHFYAMDTDPEGAVYFTGSHALPLTVAGTTLPRSRGSVDFFVTKLDQDGNLVWVVTGGGPHYDFARTLAATSDWVIIGGRFRDRVQIGDHPPVAGVGLNDGFVAALRADTGQVEWVRVVASPGNDRVQNVAFTPRGDIVLAAVLNLPDAARGGDSTLLVERLSPDGEFVWSRQGRSSVVRPEALSVAENGAVAVAGYFSATMHIDDTEYVPDGESDAFAWVLNQRGDTRTVHHVGGAGGITVTAADLSPDGRLTLAGSFSEQVELGGGTVSSPGRDTTYVLALGHNGSECATLLQGDGDVVSRSMSVQPTGIVHLAGFAGGHEFTVGDTSEAVEGAADGFVARVDFSARCPASR